MRILSWNCRGLDNPFAILQCQKNAQEYKPSILFMMETKLDRDKGAGILKKCGFWKGWEVPRVGLSGGLLLGWLPDQKLTIMHSSRNLIHTDLLDHKGTEKLSTRFRLTRKVRNPRLEHLFSIKTIKLLSRW